MKNIEMQTLRDELRTVPSIVGQAPDFDWASTPEAPRELFLQWLRAALDGGVPEAHAATLSTVDNEGNPDARQLIIKDVTFDCGFKIATSDDSAKGSQLLHDPHCALTFYWSPLARSVRIRGIAQRASAAESAKDFLARNSQARTIALAGPQSAVIASDAARDEALAQAKTAIEANADAVSAQWAVWTIEPNSVEFWQGETNRDHQRLRYTRAGATWDKQRLWP